MKACDRSCAVIVRDEAPLQLVRSNDRGGFSCVRASMSIAFTLRGITGLQVRSDCGNPLLARGQVVEVAQSTDVLADPARCGIPKKPSLITWPSESFQLEANGLDVNELTDR